MMFGRICNMHEFGWHGLATPCFQCLNVSDGPSPFFQTSAMGEHFHIGERDAGRRLLAACMDHWALVPEIALRRLFAGGGVLLNGRPAPTKAVLRLGDRVSAGGVDEAARAKDAQGMDLEVLHFSDGLLAVNKPPGCAVVRERWELGCPFMDGVLRVLRERHGRAPTPGFRPRPVHRLDRDTTGVVLVALAPQAERALCAQFRERTMAKEYIALLAGRLEADSGVIAEPVEPRPGDLTRMRIAPKGGKPSRTFYEVEERFRGCTLARCRPKTGRRHQLRVHMASVGHPVLGDPLYGGGEGLFLSWFKRGYKAKPGRPERPLIGRCALHAEAVEFALPDGRPIRVEAPLPKDFAQALAKLRKWGREG